jgi:cold shock CspA family protein
MLAGIVKAWSDEEGWGVIATADVPGDVWVHFSAIEAPGFRSLTEGESVAFDVKDLGGPIQDGYRYRATRVVPPA